MKHEKYPRPQQQQKKKIKTAKKNKETSNFSTQDTRTRPLTNEGKETNKKKTKKRKITIKSQKIKQKYVNPGPPSRRVLFWALLLYIEARPMSQWTSSNPFWSECMVIFLPRCREGSERRKLRHCRGRRHAPAPRPPGSNTKWRRT